MRLNWRVASVTASFNDLVTHDLISHPLPVLPLISSTFSSLLFYEGDVHMKIRFYMLCYRYEALVASHLDPEAFGRYMAIGTQKLTRGNVMFFEINRQLESSYFKLDDIEERCVPHSDGSPKRSKYISIYRVLEHIPLQEYGTLYLVTADGRIMGIDPIPFSEKDAEPQAHLYHELCPVSPLVASALPPGKFVEFMTSEGNPLQVPRIFFADLLVDRDESGHLAGYLPYQDPMHIINCMDEVQLKGMKNTKTISRHPVHQGFFRTINRGFYLGDRSGTKWYRFPERRVLEVEHSQWWRSASESLS